MYSLRVEAHERSVAKLKPQLGENGEPHESFLEDGEESGLDWPSPDSEIAFTAGNPRVEHLTGLVHLYRPAPGPSPTSASLTNRQQDEAAAGSAASQLPPPGAWGQERSAGSSSRRRRALPDERGLQLCCLALPTDMSVAHFCNFCGAYLAHIRGLRVLRREATGRASCCMVLLSFTTQAHADTFYQDFNLAPFSSLEPDVVCRLVFVHHVDVTHARPGSLPQPLVDALPPPGTTELPTCPVCLERLDEHISGVVTTVCNHRFHSECLQKWGDTSCPVCRYCAQPGGGAAHASRCATCDAAADLWICLICGHVGCGRYREGHARHHFTATQHCYALELETQRVWDYVGDNYVHRLIQSKTDGKLVEVPAPGSSSNSGRRRRHRRQGSGAAEHSSGIDSPACGGTAAGGQAGVSGDEDEYDDDEYDDYRGGRDRGERHSHGGDDLKEALMASKVDAIGTEYNHLLATQLDSQRHYFEGILAQAMAEADQRVATVASSATGAAEQVAQEQAAAREAERRRQAAERKLSDVTASLKKLQDEKELLRSLNESLILNQKDLQRQAVEAKELAAGRDATVIDLQEQVRDLMMFIEAGRVIGSSGGADLQGATLLPMPAPEPPKERRKGKGRK